jgi:hypothetical protein
MNLFEFIFKEVFDVLCVVLDFECFLFDLSATVVSLDSCSSGKIFSIEKKAKIPSIDHMPLAIFIFLLSKERIKRLISRKINKVNAFLA